MHLCFCVKDFFFYHTEIFLSSVSNLLNFSIFIVYIAYSSEQSSQCHQDHDSSICFCSPGASPAYVFVLLAVRIGDGE